MAAALHALGVQPSRGEEIRRKWDLIPEDIDVLITHGPPYGVLDLVPKDLTRGYENAGCEELLAAVRRIKPKLYVFGHIHEGYGVERKGGITFVNACVCDAAYQPVNLPVIFADVI